MGDAVAEPAFRELGQHLFRVRFAVTALALGHHLVFSLMTGHATQVLVFEGAGRKLLVGFPVAAGAVLGRCFVSIDDIFWHVCLVTLFAVGIGLFRGVRLVTLGAVRDLAVGIVARAAKERRMFAFVVAQLDDLLGMAGDAGVGNVFPEFYIEWRVGI